jgi:hypothetical protein
MVFLAKKMLTKHRRIYREELQICLWLVVWDKNQTYLQEDESGIGRTSGGWKFPELTSRGTSNPGLTSLQVYVCYKAG